MKKNILLLFACLIVWQAGAQTLLNRSFDTKSINHLLINNFVGPIEVTTTTGSDISVSTSRLNKEEYKETSVDFAIVDDVLMVYFKSPCTLDDSQFEFDTKDPFNTIKTVNNCNWHKDEERDLPSIKMVVRVPENIKVYASTIMGGDITISDVKADVMARNINGNVHLSKVEKVCEATTINGQVIVNYNSKPKAGGKFKTINGDIELSMSSDSDFQAKFKCFQGDLYTDIDDIVVSENSVDKKSSNNGHSFRLDGVTKVTAGNGGMVLNLETFNGNGYLKAK